MARFRFLGGTKMIKTLTGAAVAVALVVASAQAQQKTARVVGTIVGVDGPTIVVKPRGKGDEQRVRLTDNAGVFGVIPATLLTSSPAPLSASARCRRPTAARRRCG